MSGEEILGYRYRLVHQLGAGGMGVVWLAFDEVLDRQVAVKVLKPRFAGDADSRQRVLAEARAAARLTHPHVAGVYDYGESVTDDGDRVPFVVMELLHGRSLEERLQRAPLSTELALRICAEIASALAAAHAQGLVHRDVKPANVMLTASGAKVVDFGLAAVTGEPEAQGPGQALGTPAYVAPERLSGNPVVAATDVYALGLILYRLLAGRRPWPGATITEMLEAHAYIEPEPLPRLPGVPPVVTDLVHRCLAKEPGRRPASGEVTVTLAAAAGIRVPLERVDDDLGDDLGDAVTAGRGADPGADSGRGSGSGQARVRPGSPGLLPQGLVSADDPFVARLGKHLDGTLDHVALRRQASQLLRGTVHFDLAIWAVLDPMTLMWASCVVDGDGYDERFENELFANEYGQEDVLRLVDLAEGGRVGTLHASTHGDPSASRRFRTLLRPRGFTDELRLAFYDNEGTWGALLLYRSDGQFTDADVTHLAPASRPFGAVLHRTLVRGDAVADTPEVDVPVPAPSGVAGPRSFRLVRPRMGGVRRNAAPPAAPAPRAAPRTPVTGTLTISHDGRLFDVTEDARTLLETAELDRVGAAVARGRIWGLVDPVGGMRHDGRWMAFHAAERERGVAVTVQRIRPSQVSEFVTRALGLERWQWRLLGAVARNRNTRQIAQDLGMSTYAVQDGMMSLFEAFGVAGRIELVKTLFFDYYVPLHAVDVRVSPPA